MLILETFSSMLNMDVDHFGHCTSVIMMNYSENVELLY